MFSFMRLCETGLRLSNKKNNYGYSFGTVLFYVDTLYQGNKKNSHQSCDIDSVCLYSVSFPCVNYCVQLKAILTSKKLHFEQMHSFSICVG